VVPSQTALQEYSPERDRGKVYAALSVLMSAMTLIPVLLVGVLPLNQIIQLLATQFLTVISGLIILIVEKFINQRMALLVLFH